MLGPANTPEDSSLSSMSTSKRKSSFTGTLTPACSFSPLGYPGTAVEVSAAPIVRFRFDPAALLPAEPVLLSSSVASRIFWYAVSRALLSLSENATNFLGGAGGFVSLALFLPRSHSGFRLGTFKMAAVSKTEHLEAAGRGGVFLHQRRGTTAQPAEGSRGDTA